MLFPPPPPPAVPITVAYGDGVGPEILEATLHMLREGGASLTIETIEIGQRIFSMGSTTGILPGAWDSLRRTHILLKGPTIAPLEPENEPGAVICRAFDLPDLIIDEGVAYGIKEDFALFSTAEGALPELAGKNEANPSSMLLAGLRMLEYVNQAPTAELIFNAWLKTIEDGICTRDMHPGDTHRYEVGTWEFAEAVASRLGLKPADKSALA